MLKLSIKNPTTQATETFDVATEFNQFFDRAKEKRHSVPRPNSDGDGDGKTVYVRGEMQKHEATAGL